MYQRSLTIERFTLEKKKINLFNISKKAILKLSISQISTSVLMDVFIIILVKDYKMVLLDWDIMF